MFPWSTIINQVLPADNWVRSPRSSRQQPKRVAGKFRWLNDDNMQPNQTCPNAVHICARVAQIIGLKHQVLIFFSTGLVFVTSWYKQRRCQPHPAAVIQNQMNQFWRKECFHCMYTHVYLDIRTSNLDMRLPSICPYRLLFGMLCGLSCKIHPMREVSLMFDHFFHARSHAETLDDIHRMECISIFRKPDLPAKEQPMTSIYVFQNISSLEITLIILN